MKITKQFFIGMILSVIVYAIASSYFPLDALSRNTIVAVGVLTVFVTALLFNKSRE